MQKEIWKDIVGYEQIYIVSNLGRVKRIGKGQGTKCTIIKEHLTQHGYKIVDLYSMSKRSHRSVHRLVAEAFIPNPLNKSDVNHIDSDRTNNKLNNLEWCTRKENMEHCVKMGRRKIGSQKTTAKLNEKDIKNIRNNYLSNRKIALLYKVSPSLIDGIKNRTRWIHVK